MFDFLIPILIVGIITLGIYKLFELFVCRRERLMLIERMTDLHFPVPPRLLYGLNLRLSFSPLKWGCLLVGIGLGILLGYWICSAAIPSFPDTRSSYGGPYGLVSAIFGACILLMGGAGLLVSFAIALNHKNKDEATSSLRETEGQVL